MAKKKKAALKPIILANNPKNDNSCNCFVRSIPSSDWVVVARYSTMAQCQSVVDNCTELFMMMPLDDLRRRMMGL